jgi:hypothetical protein
MKISFYLYHMKQTQTPNTMYTYKVTCNGRTRYEANNMDSCRNKIEEWTNNLLKNGHYVGHKVIGDAVYITCDNGSESWQLTFKVEYND